jgi:hypothetical protein
MKFLAPALLAMVGQQVGDIGLMGAPAKKNGKAVEGFKIMLGGKIGENPALATDFAMVRPWVVGWLGGVGGVACRPVVWACYDVTVQCNSTVLHAADVWPQN